MNAVDTNVLLYACDKADVRRHDIARAVIQQTEGGVILWQVAAEFVAAARRLEVRGFTREIAWARLKNFLRVYRLVLPTPPVLDHARRLHAEQQWSFWDAMIVGACLDAGVTRLYSEDLPGRRPPPPLEIINPFA
ncbi:MAG: PIN domain-containing protein [Planctomycetota bacterium]